MGTQILTFSSMHTCGRKSRKLCSAVFRSANRPRPCPTTRKVAEMPDDTNPSPEAEALARVMWPDFDRETFPSTWLGMQ